MAAGAAHQQTLIRSANQFDSGCCYQSMEAFVQTRHGEHENVNFFQASKGFYELGYFVNKIEFDEPISEAVTKETPVFAGIPLFKKVMQKLEVNYQDVPAYPEELAPFMYRGISVSSIGEVRKSLTPWDSLFIRPIDMNRKQFNGHILQREFDLRNTLHLPEETRVYVSEVVEFVSEYRVYVYGDIVVGAKHYAGDWGVPFSRRVVEGMIRKFRHKAPKAYCLDVGVLDTHETALVEVNDAINMGNYGLAAKAYSQMIDARWKEIVK